MKTFCDGFLANLGTFWLGFGHWNIVEDLGTLILRFVRILEQLFDGLLVNLCTFWLGFGHWNIVKGLETLISRLLSGSLMDSRPIFAFFFFFGLDWATGTSSRVLKLVFEFLEGSREMDGLVWSQSRRCSLH